jgi:hypothetical protein
VKYRALAVATALIALVLMIPLAARTTEPYHNSAIALTGLAPIAALVAVVWWKRAYALAVALAGAGYALSLISRDGVDPSVALAAGLLVLAYLAIGTALDAAPNQLQANGRQLALAAASGVGAAGVAAVIALIGSWPGPGGLPAEVLGVAALVGLAALTAR